jgi:ankyrin repeat protein
VLLRKFATRGDAPNLKLLLEFCAREKNVEEVEDEVTKEKTEVVTYNSAEGIDFKEGNRGEGCPGFKEGDPKKDFKGRGIDVRNTHNGFTAFHWCCQNGTDKGIAAAETAQKALDADKSKEGRSKTNPYPDYIACMKLLVDWGANPTLLDFMGRTGRDLAALKGNFKMVEALDAYLAEHPWKEDD